MKTKPLFATLCLFAAFFVCCQEHDGDYMLIDQQESALLTDDMDPSEFPPWILPYVRPVDIFSGVVAGGDSNPLPAEEFDVIIRSMQHAVAAQFKALDRGKYAFEGVLDVMENSLDMQLSMLKMSLAISGGCTEMSFVMPHDGTCGPIPGPIWPVGPKGTLLELVEVEAETIHKLAMERYVQDRRQAAQLEESLNGKLVQFKELLSGK